MQGETAKDNCQTTAQINHDLTQPAGFFHEKSSILQFSNTEIFLSPFQKPGCHKTISTPEIFSGVHSFTGKTVILG